MFLIFTIFALVGCCLGQAAFRCPAKNGFYPDPVQCDLYYHCQDGELEEKLCPDGLLFDDGNPKNERCDTRVNVECGERTQLQKPKATPGCPRANGFFRHPDNNKCDKFVNCVYGAMHEMACASGLIYDDDQSSCVWPTETTRKDCPLVSKRDVLDDGFSCPERHTWGRTLPHPTYAHPEDCQKFYICRNGVTPQHGSCSDDQVYNEESLKCDDPENVPGCENWFDEDKMKP